MDWKIADKILLKGSFLNKKKTQTISGLISGRRILYCTMYSCLYGEPARYLFSDVQVQFNYFANSFFLQRKR